VVAAWQAEAYSRGVVPLRRGARGKQGGDRSWRQREQSGAILQSKPFEVMDGGVSVRGELYRVPDDVLERLEAGEPPGLYRGPVALHDGRVVQGILFPRQLAEGIHRDITAYGGWREYIAARDPTMQRPATQPQLGCPRPLVETAGPAASGECR
jgi:hypothetical protein